MTDEEMHNLYPVVYAKQMARGFESHTGRRAMVYSAGGYAGVQQFVATWAGDTGGGAKPLASMLNHGFSGHSNHSCDMDVFNIEQARLAVNRKDGSIALAAADGRL
jgi:alpha-glucosidase (family GH31 glycosyl hydrolase)